MNELSPDERSLLEEKYAGDAAAEGFAADKDRLAAGDPAAYVVGWQPFLGLRMYLDSKPLIPRPETEWWTEILIEHLKSKFGEQPFTFLDLCAGSGAIGLAVLAALPSARVAFGEIHAEHAETIRKSIKENNLDAARADIRVGDLFAPFASERFDIIAANPPYIPSARVLDESVTRFEPEDALYAGALGLSVIERIAADAAKHLSPGGELWMECDIANAERSRELLENAAARAELRTDLYGRPRLVVGYY